MPKPPPQIPPGNDSALRGIAENFSFHASPEAFIASRVLAFQAQRPELAASRTAVRVKILNRDVAVISSHAQITHVLRDANDNAADDAQPRYIATDAYEKLMTPFFPSPNLLLSDGRDHAQMRARWEPRMHDLPRRAHELVARVVDETFGAPGGSSVDLYASLKTLSWKILLGLFLGLDDRDPAFSEIQGLHEALLRGQFSLFPVRVNAVFWHSPRKTGADATAKLRRLILERLRTAHGSCPVHAPPPPPSSSPPGAGADADADAALDETANHVLMFTSSLAVKALASLLTAFLLNLFLFAPAGSGGDDDHPDDLIPLRDQLRARHSADRAALLRSALRETERLSPPIVGVMRRAAAADAIIPAPAADSDAPDARIPRGWDVWLYFVGGGRDPAAFGADCARFVPGRFLRAPDDGRGEGEGEGGCAFGAGAKACLGAGLVREVCLGVATALIERGVALEGEVGAAGVRGWLGWEEGVKPEDWARDMKQLPTQRPAVPLVVRFTTVEKN